MYLHLKPTNWKYSLATALPQAIPGHCLPGLCFVYVTIFPHNMCSHCTDCRTLVQTSVCSRSLLAETAKDFLRSSTTLFSLTFRRALGRLKVFAHLIVLHNKSTFYPQRISQEKKKRTYQFSLTGADNTNRRGSTIMLDFFCPLPDLPGISPFSKVMSYSFHW